MAIPDSTDFTTTGPAGPRVGTHADKASRLAFGGGDAVARQELASARRFLAGAYRTATAILVLLPYLKKQSALGWPGLSEHERADCTQALVDLRDAVGDL